MKLNHKIFVLELLIFLLIHFSFKYLEEVYAMKVYNKMTLHEKKIVLNTISEKNILKNMNSGFIVKLHYAF